jgi:hypothetical protein
LGFIGTRPNRVQNGVLAYDAPADRMLFANDLLGVTALTFENDRLQWTPVPIYGTPHYGYVSAAGVVFDPVTRRLLTTHGRNSSETFVVEIHPDRFGLTLSPIRPERGSVDRAPFKSCYDPGEPVVISATPNEGFFFDDWDGDANGSVTPLTIVMDSSMVIQAEFDRITPVLLNQFDATTNGEGVELRWRFGEDAAVQSVRVERAAGVHGPWVELALEVQERDGTAVARDPSADPQHSWFYRLVAAMADGSSLTFGPIRSSAVRAIRLSAITSVVPNPSFGAIHIQLAWARSGRVRLDVTDVAGRRVATLIDGDRRAGVVEVDWDGSDEAGARVRPGAYFLRLSTADRDAVRRLVMLR